MTTSKGSVRIIGGEHRGRRLPFTDQNGDLRPTGDRMRETLFNWLQFEVQGRRVLDLFAGSGVLAAEALSRGAVSAVVIEKKRERAADLQKNLSTLFAERIKIKCADALKWLTHNTEQFDLVFVDPPYDLQLQQPVCDALMQYRMLAPNALVYVESRRQQAAPRAPTSWRLIKEKETGDVRAQLYQLTADAGTEE